MEGRRRVSLHAFAFACLCAIALALACRSALSASEIVSVDATIVAVRQAPARATPGEIRQQASGNGRKARQGARQAESVPKRHGGRFQVRTVVGEERSFENIGAVNKLDPTLAISRFEGGLDYNDDNPQVVEPIEYTQLASESPKLDLKADLEPQYEHNSVHFAGNTQYLVYTPSGGFNNQLTCLLMAMRYAKMYNRTLIVPPNGKHSSMFGKYLSLNRTQVAPMDTALDLKYMERETGVRLTILSLPLGEFLNRTFGEGWHTSEMHAERKRLDIDLLELDPSGNPLSNSSYAREVVARGSTSESKFLIIHGSIYSKKWEKSKALRPYWATLRYAPKVLALSRLIVDKVFKGSAHFNAIHIRLGDKYMFAQKKLKGTRSGAFVRKARQAGFGTDTPVYFSTDAKDSKALHKAFIQPVLKNFTKILRLDDLWGIASLRKPMQDFVEGIEDPAFRHDMLGLVEQLVCTRARLFVGSSFSTFSKTISRLRTSLSVAVPDLAQEVMDTNGEGLMRRSVLVSYTGDVMHAHTDEYMTVFGSAKERSEQVSIDKLSELNQPSPPPGRTRS